MFPGIDGFHWTFGHLAFLSIFYGVVLVLFGTVSFATLRARRAFRTNKAETIRWHADFHDLPASDRKCRHELTGELPQRTCENGFDCRTCAVHAQFLRQTPPLPATGCMYHRGHTWAKPEPDGTVTVGLDEIGSKLVGTPDAEELPPVGGRVQVSGTAWRIRKGRASVRVLAPVDGVVVATGGADSEWRLRIKPHSSGQDVRHLLQGPEVPLWQMREMERLQLLVSGAAGVPALADGGVLVGDVSKELPESDWESVCGAMLLQP